MKFKQEYQDAIAWAEAFSSGKPVLMQQSPVHVATLLRLIRALSVRVESSMIKMEPAIEVGEAIDEELTKHAAIDETLLATSALKESISELVELMMTQLHARVTEYGPGPTEIAPRPRMRRL